MNYKEFENILKRLEEKFSILTCKKHLKEENLEEIQNLINLYRKTEYRPPLKIFHRFLTKQLHEIWN